MLAVKEAIRREFADILMLGMLGGAGPHLGKHPDNRLCGAAWASASIVEKDCRITALRGGQSAAIPYGAGFHFSVFCHSDRPEGVSIRHAKYELDNAQITNGFPIGVQQLLFGPGGCGDQRGERHFGDCGEHGKVNEQKPPCRHRIQQIERKEAKAMKVVVIKSPKFLSGILRMIFKIHKED